MASGKPDWNRIVTVQGKFGAEWIPCAVDGSGQLYIAMVGQEIDVTQLDPDRTMQGKFGANLRYISVDNDGVILARLQGEFTPDVLKDVKVDTYGNLICLMKGQSGVTETTLHVDGDGKIIAKIQSATGGDLIVFVLDDCGDTDLISNWSKAEDGLAPVESTTFVREGSKSMKLGIDADLFGTDVATWMNSETIGDLTGLNEDKVKIWVYINTLDYLLAAGTCFHYRIGSGGADYVGFNFTKASLTIGWNEISCDLSSPSMTFGTIDWAAIDTQLFEITAVAGNTDDFYIVVDSITVVRDNPDPGTMKDLNTDANGFLLSRMVGSFGDYNKPLSCDRYGNLRINPTQTDKKPLVINTSPGDMQRLDSSLAVAGVGTQTIFTLTGPGVILSGYMTHSETATHKGDYVIVTIDGVTFTCHRLELLDVFNIIAGYDEVVHLVLYDDTNHKYGLGFQRHLQYKTSLVVQWVETVNAGTVYYKVNYASY